MNRKPRPAVPESAAVTYHANNIHSASAWDEGTIVVSSTFFKNIYPLTTNEKLFKYTNQVDLNFDCPYEVALISSHYYPEKSDSSSGGPIPIIITCSLVDETKIGSSSDSMIGFKSGLRSEHEPNPQFFSCEMGPHNKITIGMRPALDTDKLPDWLETSSVFHVLRYRKKNCVASFR
jgi:hypothetical protein